MVVVAVMWRMIYDPENGALNKILEAFGLAAAKSWLGDFNLALPSVGLDRHLGLFGLAMVLLTAGVQKIPQLAVRRRARGRRRARCASSSRSRCRRCAARSRSTLTLTTIARAAQLRPRLHHDQGRARATPRRCPPSRSTTARSRPARSARRRRSASRWRWSSSRSRSSSTGSPSRGGTMTPQRADGDLRRAGRLLADRAGCRSSGSCSPRCRTPDGSADFGSFDGIHLGNFTTPGSEGHFGTYLRSSVIVAVVVVVGVRRSCRSWPATRSG